MRKQPIHIKVSKGLPRPQGSARKVFRSFANPLFRRTAKQREGKSTISAPSIARSESRAVAGGQSGPTSCPLSSPSIPQV